MKIKYAIVSILAVACLLDPGIGYAQEQHADISLVRSALSQLIQDVNALAASKGLTSAFITHTSSLLTEWEKKAPPQVQNEIHTLRQMGAVQQAQAADRLAEMGPPASGASMALIETLGNRLVRLPGDIPRLFGAQPIAPSRRAAHALSVIGESAIPALILAASQDFKDADASSSAQRKQLAFETLAMITGKRFGEDVDTWIRWFTTTTSPLIISSTAEDARKKTERVEEVGKEAGKEEPPLENEGKKTEPVGEVSIPFYKHNEFFWALLVGAAIVIALRFLK